MKYIYMLLLCVVVGSTGGTASNLSPTPTEKQLNTMLSLANPTRRPHGLALVLGDAAMTAKLSEQGFFAVDQEPDFAKFTQAAAALDRTGDLTGNRARAMWAPYTRFVLAENTTDILLACSLQDADLLRLDPQQVIALLSPYGGRAVLRAQSNTACNTWLAGIHHSAFIIATMVDIDHSPAIIIQRLGIDGGADWPLKYHDADGNPDSLDASVRLPLTTQWMGLPMFGDDNDHATVIANGRCYTVQMRNHGNPAIKMACVTCRQTSNGIVQWEEYFAAHPRTITSCLAALSDELLLCDGPRVLRIDAVSGQLRESWLLDDRKESRIAWMLVTDNTLLAVSGSAAKVDAVTGAEKEEDSVAGDLLQCFNLTTGKRNWRLQPGELIDGRSLAISDGRVICGARDRYLAAYRLANGKQLWRDDLSNDTFRTACSPIKTGRVFMLMTHTVPVVRATPKLILFNWDADLNVAAISAKDGKLRWCTWLGSGSWMIDGQRLLVAGITAEAVKARHSIGGWTRGSETTGVAYDLQTGKLLGEEPGMGTRGCGRTIASPGAYWATIEGPMWNRTSNAPVEQGASFSKASCIAAQSPLVANGVYISSAYDFCNCWQRFRGWSAWCSSPEHTLITPAQRLEQLGADVPLPLVTPDTNDWPAWRGGGAQGGSSQVNVGGPVEQLWLATPPHEFPGPDFSNLYRETPCLTPSAPVAAGDAIFVGADDGRVECLDAGSGQRRWITFTGGRISRAPAVANNRVYVGSADGYVWCFAANSGQTLWRFRLGNAEEMIFVYGHLTSRSAVVSGVLVNNGVVYAAGGFATGRPGMVVALDAVSGAPHWVREGFASDSAHGQDVVYPCGGMVIHDGQLWLRTLSNTLVRLDTANGKTLLPAGDTALSRVDNAEDGADMGVFANRWIVQGGRPWFWEQWEYYVRRLTGYSWTELDAHNEHLSPVYVLSTSAVTPAWDARTVLCIPTEFKRQVWASTGWFAAGYDGLEAWDADKTATYLQQVREDFAQRRLHTASGEAIAVGKLDWGAVAAFMNEAKQAKPPRDAASAMPSARTQVVWSDPKLWCNTLALANDAAVIIYRSAPIDGHPAHRLRICDRISGQTRVDLLLPGQPIFDGLCIDRTGRIIITLQDGSVVCYGVRK